MHWGWVLLLNCVTGGVFGAVWMLAIAQWVRRVRGKSVAYGWAWGFTVISAVNLAQGLSWRVLASADVAATVLYIVVAFLLKAELEDKPIMLPLSGVMTFFFAPVYFQYHLQEFGMRKGSLSIMG
jgi:hypothetical protein